MKKFGEPRPSPFLVGSPLNGRLVMTDNFCRHMERVQGVELELWRSLTDPRKYFCWQCLAPMIAHCKGSYDSRKEEFQKLRANSNLLHFTSPSLPPSIQTTSFPPSLPRSKRPLKDMRELVILLYPGM